MLQNFQRRIRASAICCHHGKLLMVKLKDPSTGVILLSPPGGLIEQGELPMDAAVRETLEETGYVVRPLQQKASAVDYPFVWNQVTYACTTHLIPVELADATLVPSKVVDVDYNLGARWIEVSHMSEALVYCAPLADAVLSMLPK